MTITKDVDADDPEASDLLDVIGRDTSEEEQPEEPMKAVTRTAASGGPFMLESLYFRSFGERALLTREEEVELAKKIDYGTSTIRKALRTCPSSFPPAQAFGLCARGATHTPNGQRFERTLSHRDR